MTPYVRFNAQNVEALIKKIGKQTIVPKRFSITMRPEELYNTLYAFYHTEVASRGMIPNIDAATRGHISQAAKWLADDSGKYGLMLQGLYGNGKTTLMRAICKMINSLYHTALGSECIKIRQIEATEIARLGSRDDTRAEFRKLCNADLLAIDDLGEEPAEVMSYGMAYTPVKDLLMERYRLQKFTIVSTNLLNTATHPQFTQRYGERLSDRIREMMQIITFQNGSYRAAARRR